MGKSISSLNLVSLMTMVNNGATTESICAEFLCSEEDFRNRLTEICTRPGTIEGVLADIARNEKNAGFEKPVVKAAEKPAEKPAASKAGNSAASAGNTKLSSPELDSLTSRESELQTMISTLENKANELLNKHYANTKELREREEALEAAREALESARAAFEAAANEVEKQQEDYDNCAETDKKLAKEIAAAKEDQKSAEQELEETRNQIFELTHASILVMADGTIQQTSGKTQLDLDDSGSDVLFKELSEKEEFEDLPVKKVRILAKLLKVVEHSKLELEVSCEDPDLNRAYLSSI